MPGYFYPEKIIRAVGVAVVCGQDTYVPLSDDRLTDLESKIASLPTKYRSALLLHYRGGLTYQRIADENGFVSPSAAWACIRTGLGRLKRMYGAKMGRKETESPSAPEESTVSRESAPHELAVARNDRAVQVGEDGKGTYQGFAAPRASEFFATRVPMGRKGSGAGVDNTDGGM